MTDLAVATTDQRGMFSFADLPNGTYRLAAMKWTGPYKGLFDKQGTVVQLLGTANNIKVPPEGKQAERIVLTPPGRRILDFQQESGNDGPVWHNFGSNYRKPSTSPTKFRPGSATCWRHKLI